MTKTEVLAKLDVQGNFNILTDRDFINSAPIAPMMKGIDVPCMGKDSLGWGNVTGLASVFMARDRTHQSPFWGICIVGV
jgi:hypothetical protein